MAERERLGAGDALLVIDVQNDFCTGGALEVPNGEAVVPLINTLMPLFSTVVLTQDWHPPGHSSFASAHGKAPFSTTEMPYGTQVLWPDHCVQGSPGAAFHPVLKTGFAQIIQRKGANPRIDSYSAFFENDRKTTTGLAGWLREKGVSRLYCAGLATDFCVLYSALDGRKEGFEVTVIADACRGIDLEGSLAKAWDDMKAAGVHTLDSAALTGDGE